jgi:3-oxoacyl-(acyl-carrier-protein) synthase
MSRSRQAVAVTGFYAGHYANAHWFEYAASSASGWRSIFERSPSYLQYGTLSQYGAPGSEYLAARIIRELRWAGLWRDRSLVIDPLRLGVCVGSSKGRLGRYESPLGRHDILSWTCDWAATDIARLTCAQGPLLAPVAACATGSYAIAIGAQWIADGYADIVLAGGIEVESSTLAEAGYHNIGALSRSGVMRPFDRRRDGFLAGEGGALLILESAAHARRRRANICGYITGWAMCSDPTSPVAMDPSGKSIAGAIQVALKRAGNPSVDYINAHGTATQRNDLAETRGIKSVFADKVPVSGTKPVTNHLFGASGAVEAVLCLLAMRDGFLPPTLNLEEQDEECDLDYIANSAREHKIDATLSLNYGFGGHVGALIFQQER